MKIEYKKSFAKDIKSLKSKKLRLQVKEVILKIKSAGELSELSDLKKLKGHKTAYRIRIGNYRLGLFFEKDTVIIVRLVHRKDIYKRFP